MPELNRRLVIGQDNRLSPVPIEAAPVRGSTYVTPAQPKQGGNGFGDFLTSLGSMSGHVAAIAAKRDAKEKDEQTLAANKQFEGMTLEQAREMVATKQINQYESPYFRAAFLARLGQNEAAARKRDLVKRFEDPTQFDKLNGNLESWVDEQTKADLARLPDNEHVTRAYLAEINGFAGALANKQVDAQISEIAEARKDQVSKSLNTAVLGAESEGLGSIERVIVTRPPVAPTTAAVAAKPGAKPAPVGTAIPAAFDALAGAVMHQESRGNPNAVSPKGARGLMQVMPGTNTNPGFGVRPARDNSEAERTRVGRDYLQAMLKRYSGNVPMALAAYNAGPGRVDEWIKTVGDPRKGTISAAEWAARLPIKETRDYVPSVLKKVGAGGADGAALAAQIDFFGDVGAATLPDGSVVESATARLKDPNGFAARIFRTVEENAVTGLATRREQEDMILAMLPDMANAGKDAQIAAILDYDRGPAGTLRQKLGPRAEVLIDAAKHKREAEEDTSAAAQLEDLQFKLGVKADRGQLTEDDINGIRKFGITDRVSIGRKPLVSGEYIAGLVNRQTAFLERQAAEAQRRAEEAARLAEEKAAQGREDQIFASGLGHELSPTAANDAAERAYARNRQLGGADHTKRRALDLKTYRQTNVASPFSQRLLASGSAALRSGAGVGADGQAGTQLRLAVEEYQFYRRHDPGYLAQIVPAKDRELFDSYFTLTEGGVMTSQQALLRVQSIATGEFKPKAISPTQRNQIRDAIKEKGARLGGVSGFFAGDAKEGSTWEWLFYAGQENRSAVTASVERYAETLMRAGAEPKAAVDAAIAKEGANWSQFDGVLVHHNSVAVPQVFKKGLGPAVDHLLETKLKGTGYDRGSGLISYHRSNIMVQAHPREKGKWLIIDKQNFRVPLAVVTTQDIVNAAAREANKPGFWERAEQIGSDLMNPSRLVRLRRETPKPK